MSLLIEKVFIGMNKSQIKTNKLTPTIISDFNTKYPQKGISRPSQSTKRPDISGPAPAITLSKSGQVTWHTFTCDYS